ncbi:MAG TPA: response regulator transcription factor [Cytophagales bacterium]|nr:response regulator transcription factor [Cytophagales bacterium]
MDIQQYLDRMLSTIKSFDHNPDNPPENYDKYLDLFKNDTFKQFASKSPQIVALYNFITQKYEFVSESIVHLYGKKPENFTTEFGARAFIEMLTPTSIDLLVTQILPMMLQHCNKHASRVTDLRFTACLELQSIQQHSHWVLMHTYILCATSKGFPILSCSICTDVTDIKKDNLIHYSAHLSKDGSSEVLYLKSYGAETSGMHLSSREIEVIQLLCQGKTSKEIADELFVSFETVKKHRSNILEKTHCTNTAELINLATAMGLT